MMISKHHSACTSGRHHQSRRRSKLYSISPVCSTPVIRVSRYAHLNTVIWLDHKPYTSATTLTESHTQILMILHLSIYTIQHIIYLPGNPFSFACNCMCPFHLISIIFSLSLLTTSPLIIYTILSLRFPSFHIALFSRPRHTFFGKRKRQKWTKKIYRKKKQYMKKSIASWLFVALSFRHIVQMYLVRFLEQIVGRLWVSVCDFI